MRHVYAFTPSILLLIVLSMAGCKNGEESASDGGDVPPDLEIIFGQQGTFAGRGMGYSINAAGEVVRWEGKYPGEIAEAETTIAPKQVKRLWQHAEDIGFLSMQDQAMATTYYFISVSAAGESRRVTWVGREKDAPTPSQTFFDKCMETARAAFGH